MEWQATDQFGNLYVGISAATSFDELAADVVSLVAELRSRASGPIRVTLDSEYREINGPDPENVSHILQCDWIGSVDKPLLIDQLRAFVAENSKAGDGEPITVESSD